MAPVRADERLDLARNREPVLRQLLLECQRLPSVRIGHLGAGLRDDERLVGGGVRIVDVALLLERPVCLPFLDNRSRDALAEGGRVVALGLGVVGPEAEARHRGVQLRDRRIEVGDRRVAPIQDVVCGEADGRLTRGLASEASAFSVTK